MLGITDDCSHSDLTLRRCFSVVIREDRIVSVVDRVCAAVGRDPHAALPREAPLQKRGWTRTCRICRTEYPFRESTCPSCRTRVSPKRRETRHAAPKGGIRKNPSATSSKHVRSESTRGAQRKENGSKTVIMPWPSQLEKIAALRKSRLHEARRTAPPEKDPHSIYPVPGGRPDSNRRRH